MTDIKARIRISVLTLSLIMMSQTIPTAILAQISAAYPHVPVASVQSILTLSTLVSIPLALLMGKLPQYVSKRTMILSVLVLSFIGGVLPLIIRDSFEVLIFCAVMLGLEKGTLPVLTTAFIVEHFKDTESATMMGLQGAVISAAGGGMSLLAGWLGSTNWLNAYFLYLLYIPVFAVVWTFLPIDELEKKQQGQKTRINGLTIFMCASILLTRLFSYAYTMNASLYIENAGLGNSTAAGIASALSVLAGIVGGVTIGKLIVKVEKYIYLMGAALLTTGFGLILLFQQSLVMFMLGGFIGGLMGAILMPYGLYRIPRSYVGAPATMSLALYMISSGLGGAIPPYTIGRFVNAMGWDNELGSFAVAFVGGVLLMVVGVFVLLRKLREERKALYTIQQGV